MSKRVIPQRALEAQSVAADPSQSVWVSANAGSGKTHVLTERVIRLLLQGVKPSRLLCLTYTKAAAAVMKARVFERLSRWTSLSDEQLTLELYQLEKRKPDAIRLKEARRLFAHALDTPGGLKIQTIHAFCEALLHQFPLEANIAGHFEIMDEMATTSLLGEARRQVLTTAHLRKNENLSEALTTILDRCGEEGLNPLLSEAIDKRQNLIDFFQKYSSSNTRRDILCDVLGIERGLSHEQILASLKNQALLDDDLTEVLRHFGGKTAIDFTHRLAEIKLAPLDDGLCALVKAAYFTKQDQPRKPANIIIKEVQKLRPAAIDIISLKQQNMLSLFDTIKNLNLIALNIAASNVVEELLKIYSSMKKARGLLDFNDIIHYTLAMLKRRGANQWVQYKLDRGIDHILVDEAQDTSPAQWEIIQRLTEEFFSGLSQNENTRTIFAVGDEKQSIYSFQGAVPEGFAANGRLIARKARQSQQLFSNVQLHYSFRSTEEVLSSVDLVFSKPENFQGLSADNAKTVHQAIRTNEPGEVDIWQTITPQSVAEPDDWRLPVDQLRAPAVQLAETIAETIAHWLKTRERIAGKNRTVNANDIIILVRKRDQFIGALSRALKNRHVPVAGVDRLKLTDHIAIRDLMALGQFVLQPADDLALASLFKSPFFNLTEGDLLEFASKRKATLWDCLTQANLASKPKVAAMVERLKHYRKIADNIAVFEFYSLVLHEDGGRRDILSRLGTEAGDVLDAFMDYSLTIQKFGLPGLQIFLETLNASEPEIKRELDQSRQEVRIMTIHAAKGLESSIVFLVDSCSKISVHQHEPHIIMLNHGQQQVPIFIATKDCKSNICLDHLRQLKQRESEEYRRTLYVAMTRAEDRLIVCSYCGKKPEKDSWSRLIYDALSYQLKEIEGPSDSIAAWRYSKHNDELAFIVEPEPKSEGIELQELPQYLRQKMAPEHALPRPLTPSRSGAFIENDFSNELSDPRRSPLLEADFNQDFIAVREKNSIGERLALTKPIDYTLRKQSRNGYAIERGIVIHKILQYLPDIPQQERPHFVERMINRVPYLWNDEQKQHIAKDILSVISFPQLKEFFDQEGKSEVAIMGRVTIRGAVKPVSGQIDRIRITDDKVLIGDYKTGPVPSDTKTHAPGYIAQMALYRALVKPLYPDKSVEVFLIYTQGPKIFKVDDLILDQAMVNLGREREVEAFTEMRSLDADGCGLHIQGYENQKG